MSGNTSKRYPPELKSRAVRMFEEIRQDHATDWEAMGKVAQLLGVSTAETVRKCGSDSLSWPHHDGLGWLHLVGVSGGVTV